MIDPATIFIHIPKTGGRSVCRALGIKWTAVHKRISEYEAEGMYSTNPLALKISTVRNPWDRCVSMWVFFGHMTAPTMVVPFDKWLLLKRDAQAKAPEGFLLRPIFDQMKFCTLKDGSIGINRFLRFETLDADFASVAPILKVDPVLPRIGADEKTMQLIIARPGTEKDFLQAVINDYHAAYTNQELVDAVSAMDGDTIKNFGYSYP